VCICACMCMHARTCSRVQLQQCPFFSLFYKWSPSNSD
jgi:hypothetical protein